MQGSISHTEIGSRSLFQGSERRMRSIFTRFGARFKFLQKNFPMMVTF
jgi:hypothetical protein